MTERQHEMHRHGDAPFEGLAEGLAGDLMDDEVEALRLADALDALEEGRTPDIDPREDPKLHELIETASLLANVFAEATEQPAFESFRARSRAAVIHRSERAPAEPAAPPQSPRVLPFYRRMLPVFSPIAAAAAAAGVTFLALSGGVTDTSPPPQTVARQGDVEVARDRSVVGLDYVGVPGAPPGTEQGEAALTVEDQLVRFQSALQQIAARVASGQPVDSALLRQAAERAGEIKAKIESNPDAVSSQMVTDYAMATATSKNLLISAEPEPGAEGALEAARVTAEGGLNTVRQYFLERLDQKPISATPEPTPTPTPDATAEPTATPTPGATATPEATADPAADSGDADASATPTP